MLGPTSGAAPWGGRSLLMLIWLLLSWLSIPAQASSLQLSTVRLALSPLQPSAAFTVTNQGERRAVVQVQLMAW
jgi:P pilus assembly chaperone PapD